jgi:hypothetical protein
MKLDKKAIGLMASALPGQFTYSVEQLHLVMQKIGFSFVSEVALGAGSMSPNDALDLKEHLAESENFMRTSYCAADNTLVKKRIPDLKSFVSSTGPPLSHMTESVRE